MPGRDLQVPRRILVVIGQSYSFTVSLLKREVLHAYRSLLLGAGTAVSGPSLGALARLESSSSFERWQLQQRRLETGFASRCSSGSLHQSRLQSLGRYIRGQMRMRAGRHVISQQAGLGSIADGVPLQVLRRIFEVLPEGASESCAVKVCVSHLSPRTLGILQVNSAKAAAIRRHARCLQCTGEQWQCKLNSL